MRRTHATASLGFASGVKAGWVAISAPVVLYATCFAACLAPAPAHCQPWTLTPLAGFGDNGWVSGTAFGASGTNNGIRSMAYNPVTGNLLVANGSALQVVNGTTGAVGSTLSASGVTGGARALNTVTVMTDGVIYGSNLTTNGATSSLRIYRWADESAVPSLFYSGDGGEPGGARIGDTLTSFGNDTTGVLAFGTGTTATVGTTYFSFLPTNGGVAGAAVAMSGTGVANQSFRTGLVMIDADTVLGLAAGSTTNNAVVSGATAPWTRDGLRTIANANERSASALTSVFGTSLLATMQFGSTGTNTVRIYDATNITTASLGAPLASGNIALSSGSNGNGSVGIAFGTVAGNPVLYGMNTNNGIQAFQVAVPEPTTWALLATGVGAAGAAAVRRRRRRG